MAPGGEPKAQSKGLGSFSFMPVRSPACFLREKQKSQEEAGLGPHGVGASKSAKGPAPLEPGLEPGQLLILPILAALEMDLSRVSLKQSPKPQAVCEPGRGTLQKEHESSALSSPCWLETNKECGQHAMRQSPGSAAQAQPGQTAPGPAACPATPQGPTASLDEHHQPVTRASACIPSRVSRTTCMPCSAWLRTQWGQTRRGPMTSTCCTQESKAAHRVTACQPGSLLGMLPLLPRPGWSA